MASSTEQTIFAPDNLANFVRPEGNLPTLADLLTLEGRGSIFYSYARETDISARFAAQAKEGEGTTLFVPTNKAVQALARKPHEDPDEDKLSVSDKEHEAISKSNVQRWVGAHIVPSPNVDLTSSEAYDTLTTGATITFHSISSKHSDHHSPHEPHIDTDAAHLDSVKDRASHVDTDAAHMAAIKPYRRPSHSTVGTDAAHFASIKGPASPDRAQQPDADATHLSDVKGSSHGKTNIQTPIWKRYELNDGVHIISEKKASNGVMYLIDGTVPV